MTQHTHRPLETDRGLAGRALRTRCLRGVLLLASVALGGGCSSGSGSEDGGAEARAVDPDESLARLAGRIDELGAQEECEAVEVEVQHLLVGIAGAPNVDATRSLDEARQLAAELFVRLEDGEDFDGLVRSHSDDGHPGIYTMTTAEPDPQAGIFGRDMMARAFGDVSWRLAVGEIGVTEHDAVASPFGFHIIKRLR